MNTLKAEKRSMSVKAKKLRREGYVTGNLFGRKIEGSIPLQMTTQEVNRLLATSKKGSQIMLNVDGTEYDVLIKDIDRNNFEKTIYEIDFQALVSDEKVHSSAEVIFLNTDKVVEGTFEIALTEIPYKAYPSALISEIKVDVSHMKLDDVIRVKDLDIAHNKDIDLMIDPERVLGSVCTVHVNLEEPVAQEAPADAPASKASGKSE